MVYYNAYLSELGAHESEYLLGNEAFIDKIVRKDKSLAAKIIDKIRNLKSMFEKTNDTKTKKEQRLVNKAEKLWLNAVEKAGLKYSGGRIYRRREVDVEAQNEYNGEVAEVRLSRKDKLLYGIFPTYKESAGSEANTLATRWAHRADIQTGDRTAISYHDNWYLIEKFEDSDLGYQIVAQITAKQYQEFIEERNNGIGKGQSIQKGVSSLTSIDRRANSSNRGVVSDNPLSPRNGRGDNQVQRVGEEQSQRGKTQSNRSGDSEGGGQGKQRIKFSLKIGDETLQGIGEENRNLVALHNLSETKLLKVLELGGFPMPSIAVTRAELSHDEFGDITVIFGRDTIDPQKRKENKVYSKDGWTPTVPQIEYKPSEKVQKRIHDKYYALAREVGYETVRPLYKYVSDIERVLENIPIHRANSAKTIDSSSFFDEGNRVSDASFNKDTVQGAKGELYIEGLDEVLDRHIHGISLYAGLATVIDQYDILYNLNMSEDANKPITVRTESENTWAKGNDYFKKLISDLQGISPTRGGGSKLFGFFRGHYATYQLGLNPKVWFTQLSSFFASGSILDYSSILKGLSINTKDVDEYCQLAAVRNNDNSAAMAQGVMDKVDKIGSVLMKPIGMVDRLVIKKLFGACQVQVEKESGLKIGTEENKKKAGELLEKVIVETQQNSMATERSAAMRSGSELMKTLTMFTADSMKVFGRVVDSLGEVSVLKAKIKETTDSKVRAELEEKLKAAKKKSVKSVAALATTAIFMALIAQAFRWLYNKDDDDENIPANMAIDAIGNLMGGLPLIKDLYAKLTEGYDLNNYSYSALNDLFDAFSGTISTVTSLAKGEEVKPLRTVKELSYAVGQILGLPTRNVYNIIYGLTKRISPSTAYGWDSNLYNKNYSTDLQKAIDNDDDDMLATIVGLMLNEKVGGIDNSFAREEMDRLVKGGYKVLPKSVGNTIIYDGEEVAITSKQREQFKKVYGEANKALASLVNDKSYASASDEVKAKAVRFIYDIYYNLAIEDLLGVDLETKNILFAKAIDISSLAIIVATARSLEADTDKKGNVISGSRKKKVQTYINSLGLKAAQKYMIMGYLGYSNKYGQQQVKSYIQRLSLTKSEKEKLYEYSGYAA